MDIGSLLLILSLLILVGLFISRPFFAARPAGGREVVGREEHDVSSLLAERDRLINALQELDFDHALGKIPEEDYPIQRRALLQQGADVLRHLDALQHETERVGAEERLEAVVAARRADARRGVGEPALRVAEPDDTLEAILANRRRERQEKAAGFCPQCGGPVQKSDRFCPKCGTTLATAG